MREVTRKNPVSHGQRPFAADLGGNEMALASDYDLQSPPPERSE